MAADLYGDVPAEPQGWRARLPGIALVAATLLAAAFVAERHGAPSITLAPAFGLLLNFIAKNGKLQAGLRFAAGHPLRWGIVLAGTGVGQPPTSGPGLSALLVPLVAAAALLPGRRGRGDKGRPMVWALAGFLAVAWLEYRQVVPPPLSAGLRQAADMLLTAALTAIAIRTPIAWLRSTAQ